MSGRFLIYRSKANGRFGLKLYGPDGSLLVERPADLTTRLNARKTLDSVRAGCTPQRIKKIDTLTLYRFQVCSVQGRPLAASPAFRTADARDDALDAVIIYGPCAETHEDF